MVRTYVIQVYKYMHIYYLGDRIIGAGLSSLALTAKQCDKRKAFEVLAPSLLVNSEGIATWENLELVSATTGENCKAPSLRNCPIH